MATFKLTADDAGLTTIGTAGNDLFVSTSDAINTTLEGGDGSDILKGAEGSTLRGQAGNDYLEMGGMGNGVMEGGDGNDQYKVRATNTGLTVINESTGSGIDTVVSETDFSLSDPGKYNFSISGSVENLFLAVLPLGTGPTFAEGNNLNNVVVGNREDNTLNGLGGDDSIFGSFGNDTIDGGAGADSLEGNQGDDVIDGGQGNDNIFGDKAGAAYAGDDTLNGGADLDTLTGGLGADTFAFGGVDLTFSGFNTRMSKDTVTDFNRSEGDKIQIDTQTFNAQDLIDNIGNDLSALPNGLISSNFGNNDFGMSRLDAYFVHNIDTGSLLYNPNLAADGLGVSNATFAEVSIGQALLATDIVITGVQVAKVVTVQVSFAKKKLIFIFYIPDLLN